MEEGCPIFCEEDVTFESLKPISN